VTFGYGWNWLGSCPLLGFGISVNIFLLFKDISVHGNYLLCVALLVLPFSTFHICRNKMRDAYCLC
jgi:hypothetical protein